jgi:hypothetical protein
MLASLYYGASTRIPRASRVRDHNLGTCYAGLIICSLVAMGLSASVVAGHHSDNVAIAHLGIVRCKAVFPIWFISTNI